MQDFQSLRIFNKLKSVYRFNSVDNRKESVAEHSWGCLILADYFMTLASYNLDRTKVYELVMYHDLLEIQTGDAPIQDEKKYQEMFLINDDAMAAFKPQMPNILSTKFESLFDEFTNGTSKEAFFARAISGLEAEIHELDYKKDWKGWTKEFLLNKKTHLFDQFPEMMTMFLEIVEYLDKNKYFNQQ